MKKRKNRRNRRVSGEKTYLVEAGKATRFKAGISGNPLGRPATKIFRDTAREIAGMVDTRTKKTRVRKLMERAFKEAEKGSLGHFKQIHRLIEEDSISQNQTAEVVEVVGGKEACAHCGRGPRRSATELVIAIRAIYGIGEPDTPGAEAEQFPAEAAAQETAPPQPAGG